MLILEAISRFRFKFCHHARTADDGRAILKVTLIGVTAITGQAASRNIHSNDGRSIKSGACCPDLDLATTANDICRTGHIIKFSRAAGIAQSEL